VSASGLPGLVPSADARLKAKEDLMVQAHEELIDTARAFAFGSRTEAQLVSAALEYSERWGEYNCAKRAQEKAK
jgi:hypothetical protein